MFVATQQQYYGRVVTVNPEGFGFIGLGTVITEDGSVSGLETSQDIFIHQDDCDPPLRVGLEVTFDVVPDERRGDGALRAQGAIEVVEAELLPTDEQPIPGFNIQARADQAVAAIGNVLLTLGGGTKSVPEETVRRVVDNNPMPGIPREEGELSSEDSKNFLSGVLEWMFEKMRSLGANFRLGEPEATIEEQLEEAVTHLRAMGADPAAEALREEVGKYKDIKTALERVWEEGVVRTSNVIPMSSLPDLFAAVPVWYEWVDSEGDGAIDVERAWDNGDPPVAESTAWFCEQIPNQRWADVFQMFNRRVRTLARYEGDMIPPHVARRMRWATELFDYVVIATPYHEVAGRDWEDLDWLRSIDPYVLGFKKGLPFFFVLARFSDTGVFPHYHEMVADTIEFLRANKARLRGFNAVFNPYWHYASSVRPDHEYQDAFGSYLMAFTEDLLSAFESGRLFDWLRGDIDLPVESSEVAVTEEV